MTSPSQTLRIHPEPHAVAHFPPDADLPSWFIWSRNGLTAVTRTQAELSLVTPEEIVPRASDAERGWRVLEVEGPLDFEQVGVLSSLLEPLASAGIPVFVVSTFLTDYVLVKHNLLQRTLQALRSAGHRFKED